MKDCAFRGKMVIMGKDGEKSTVRRCSHPQAEAFGTDVTPEICEACTHVVAPARPPAFGGFPACDDRSSLPIIPTCCGGPNTKEVCGSESSRLTGQEVTPSQCRNCTSRRTKF